MAARAKVIFMKKKLDFKVCPQSNQGRRGKTLTAVSIIRTLSPPLNTEWTQISTRYLREQLVKISDFYHMASSTGDGPVPVPPEVEQAMKQWEYNEKLAFHMFQVIWRRHARKGHLPHAVMCCSAAGCILRAGLLGALIVLQTSQSTLCIKADDRACYILRLFDIVCTFYVWSLVDQNMLTDIYSCIFWAK